MTPRTTRVAEIGKSSYAHYQQRMQSLAGRHIPSEGGGSHRWKLTINPEADDHDS